MKKLISALAAAVLLAGCAPALAQEFDGTVTAGETVTLTAPYGGVIKRMDLREGALLSVGDPVVVMDTTRVLASEDGTIRGLNAQEGDSAEGTVLYLSPVDRYVISASLSYAYESPATTYVTLGEKVYMKCASDGSHKAEGIITAVNGSSYTVEATAGELYLEETVYIYRTQDYYWRERIGSGTVARMADIAVSGSGSVLKLHVQDGEEVERGQLLFETVEGSFDALLSPGSTIQSAAAGVVAHVAAQAGQKVQKGDVLATVYQTGDYQVQFSIAEDVLPSVHVGDSAQLYFNWSEDDRACTGTVTEISYLAETGEGSGEAAYSGYIAFVPDETVRLGMSVTVVLDD